LPGPSSRSGLKKYTVPASLATPPPPAMATTLQSGPPETTFQSAIGSQASVLPVPPLPVETREIVDVVPETSARKRSALASASSSSWSKVVKKTLLPSSVMPP
jgi:hypothetical protein